jgi:hypothetical protein
MWNFEVTSMPACAAPDRSLPSGTEARCQADMCNRRAYLLFYCLLCQDSRSSSGADTGRRHGIRSVDVSTRDPAATTLTLTIPPSTASWLHSQRMLRLASCELHSSTILGFLV